MLVQPKITADAVGLNITTTFVSLLFWTLLLGPMGAVLAVPLTLFFKCILFDTEREPTGCRSSSAANSMKA